MTDDTKRDDGRAKEPFSGLLETPSDKPLTEGTKDELTRWEADRTKELNYLMQYRLLLAQMPADDPVVTEEFAHFGATNCEAVHSMTMHIAVLTSTIVTIMGRLADIEARESAKQQGNRMWMLNIVVALMVLLQVLLSFGVIDKIADRSEQSPPAEREDSEPSSVIKPTASS